MDCAACQQDSYRPREAVQARAGSTAVESLTRPQEGRDGIDVEGKLIPFGTLTVFTAVPIFGDGIDQSVEGGYSVGFGFGGGIEYFIATQFSIGSEFGLNVLFYGADEANDPTPGSLSGHVLNTYLGFSLNYYLSQG